MVPIVTICAALSVAAADVGPVRADSVPRASMAWLDKDYPYLVIDQALPDTLREFGHNLDVTVDVSPEAKGRVRQYHHEGSAGDFLDHLTTEHRLDWVFDQGRLFISAAEEKAVRSWPGGADGFESARAALASASLDDPRFPIGYDSTRGEISLFAPPQYLSLAAPVIERMLAPAPTRTVTVIHGRSRPGGT